MEEISQQSEPIQSKPLTPKRKVVIAIVVFSLISSLVQLVIDKIGADQFGIIALLLSSIGYGVLILMWCKADSEERGGELSSRWKLMLVALGLFAFIAYLFKSRGFAKGLLSVLYTLGFAIGVFLFDVIVLMIGLLAAALIFGKEILK